MDCRKLLWLGGLMIAGLVGCKHHANVADGNPYWADSAANTATNSAPRPAPESRSAKRGDSSAERSKVPDAKPESCVKIGNLKAEIALDKSRSEQDRASSARLARNAYNQALQLDPKCLDAYLGLGRLSTWLDEYDQAMATYGAALAKFPKKAIVHYERGMCLARQKKLEEAIPDLTAAAQLEPGNHQYTKGVGLLMARLGKSDEAVGWLIKSMPEADARYNIARMMEHIGREDEKQRQLQLALKADPKHQAALALLNGPNESEAADSVKQAGHEGGTETVSRAIIEQPTPVRIEVGTSLPRRPEPLVTIAPDATKPARPAPVIPVISDQWEQKPPPPAPIDGPKSSPGAKPNVQIGFDPNP
jgi:thioredoxin-like negative regulator of GroEL